ncbi:MAG: phosphoglycolate phosphatase [Gammaproteobacteria bacterium]|nr:phosphoglycolate phosphatase [Gammaproteobacteria bacterium]
MILIDLDGTLVDSVPDLAHAVDVMMKAIGMPERGEERVREWIGNGAERLVRRALIDRVDGEPDEALFRRAYPVFLDAYQENVSRDSRPYPGVIEGLAALKAAGFMLGCVTNKPACFTEPLLKTLGMYDSFGIVISGDSLPTKKPDPAPLLHAAAFFGVAPERSLMVGDSINDVLAARAAGFAVACVTYGYNHGNDIREADPDAVIDSLAELPALLEVEAAQARLSGNDA